MVNKIITCKCGHDVKMSFEESFIDTPNFKGLISELSDDVCDECYFIKNNVKEFKVKYLDYMTELRSFRKKSNSYNKEDKTIIIYVPRDDQRFSY